MPTNLTKTYNQLLDLLYPSERQNIESIRKVYDRDFCSGDMIVLRNLPVEPTPAHGENEMDRMFKHLTTVVVDKCTKRREFESERSIRIHWIRHHIEGRCVNEIYKIDDEGRIYIINRAERYVVILEPKRNDSAFLLLTAYKLESSNYRKIMNKCEKRGKLI